jgi:HEAT repeat protein
MEDLDLRDQAPAVRKLTTDSDESTAVQAIGTLGRWGDEASRSLIEEALKSKSQRTQNAAKAALRRLDGAVKTQSGPP